MKFKVLLCVFALLFGLMLNAAMNADRYKTENEDLLRRLTEMYADIIERDELKEENERLREMLGIIEENEDFTLSPPCAVIAREAMSVSGNFTINRGSNSGIKTGDPVITKIGLVGRVVETAPTFSRVMTVLSTEIHIGVKTASGEAFGIIDNDILFSSDRKCLMGYIEIGSNINPGDVVVTAGGTGIFPPGLVIGTVSEVFPHDNGMLLYAVIEPAEDVFRLTDVFVITSFEGQGVLS